MLVAERRERVLDQVRRQGTVSVAELASSLGVSAMTVRRDLDLLADAGELTKVRGGATVTRSRGADGPPVTTERNVAAKRAIAATAARFVEPGMSIGLSGGSTATAVARELRRIPGLTIVTSSLPVAGLFQRGTVVDESYSQTVVLTGGVRTPSDVLVGPVAVRSLEHLHLDLVFLGVHGVDPQTGLTTPNLLEAETYRALVDAGAVVVVVADHSKWGTVGLATIADFDAVDRFVTDDGLDAPRRDELASLVGELWIAGQDAPWSPSAVR